MTSTSLLVWVLTTLANIHWFLGRSSSLSISPIWRFRSWLCHFFLLKILHYQAFCVLEVLLEFDVGDPIPMALGCCPSFFRMTVICSIFVYFFAKATARSSLTHEEKQPRMSMSNGRSYGVTLTACRVIVLTSWSFSFGVDELLVFSGIL